MTPLHAVLVLISLLSALVLLAGVYHSLRYH